jgi:hexosaminidase
MRQGDPSIEPPVYNNARLKTVYAFDILTPEIDSAYVLGGQANVWTEQIPSTPQVEYMMYPRTLAVSENLWSPKNKKEWNGFVSRVENQFVRLDKAGINYSPAMYDPIIQVKRNAAGRLTIELTTEVPGLDLYYTVDNTIPNQYYSKYIGTIEFPEGADTFRVISYKNGKAIGRLISLKAEDLEKRVRK